MRTSKKNHTATAPESSTTSTTTTTTTATATATATSASATSQVAATSDAATCKSVQARPRVKAGESKVKAAKEGIKEKSGNKTEVTLLSAAARHDLMAALRAQNPNPQSELNFRNSFELLCAVVLSAQATDKSVNLATPALFAAAPDPEHMIALGEEGIAPFIQSIGLWRNKAKSLYKIATILHEHYHDTVPDSYEELIKLPGVGSKTAKVVLNVAFGQPYIAVDTHVFRVCNRTGLCLGKSPVEVEQRLPELIDPEFLQEAHHYLLLHGRYVCTAKNYSTHCKTCVAAPWCKHHTVQH